jgi:hypothetical protein
MVDFVAILKKALDKHGDETPGKRTRIYDSVRAMLAKKLAEMSPPLAEEAIAAQKRALEDAIAGVERGYAMPVPEADPLAELEQIFSSIDRNRNQPSHSRQPAKAEPAWPATPAAKPEPYRPVPPAPTRAEPNWQRPTPPQPTADAADRNLPGLEPEREEDQGEVFMADDGPTAGDTFQRFRPAERKRSYGGLIAAVVALLVIAGGGYGIWLNKSAFGRMFGSEDHSVVKTEPLKAEPAKPAGEAAATPAPAAAGNEAASTKFTQRLTPQGSEVDPGPAAGQSGIGEGESVAALTTPPPASAPAAPNPAAPAPAGTGATPAAPTPPEAATPSADGAAPAATGAPPADAAAAPAATPGAAPTAPAAPAAAAAETSLLVGQKAIFYEERTSTAQGSAEPGSIVWSLVQESPGGDLPPEPAIRAEATIPGKDIQLRMTIRRNTDQTLPASHIIEMIFLTPDGFEGGGVDNILRVAMKSSEQDAGSPLIGVPAKIADGFFLVALNDTKADEDANLTLLRGQDWIDVPVVYKTGRRALLTMEKGIPGEKVFDEAIKAWQAKTAG